MNSNKVYPIRISPEILELLGPSLYTNIYYVLAELIANSYDADAENVWLDLSGDSIIIEDDGHGMTYQETVNKYLEVAKSTRNTEAESKSRKFQRPKMGRKGIGKLAALAISSEVRVMTKSNGELSGFTLTRSVPKDGKLLPIKDTDIHFDNISVSGTRIEMLKSEFQIPATSITVKKNLSKFFPQLSSDKKNPFIIHIKGKDKKTLVADSFVDSLATSLDSLLIIGNDTYNIIDKFKENAPKYAEENLREEKEREIAYSIINKDGKEVDRILKIKGWIGTYHTTRGLKAKESTDFPDNFLAIYSHEKLGQFNVLNEIGQNRLNEVYVVGQLYVDEFEETSLPDMALSNRQGYKSDDIRYQKFIEESGKILTQVLRLKEKAIKAKKKNSDESKRKKKIDAEKQLKESVESTIAYIDSVKQSGNLDIDVANKVLTDMGIKKIATDQDTKKILLSHTRSDQKLNNIIYGLLLLNGFKDNEIIYTSDPENRSGVPHGSNVFDYLRDFFIQSYSQKQIYVLYIYSNKTCKSPGVLQEIGAGWIVRTDHGIIKAGTEKPEAPLNIDKVYPTVYISPNQNEVYTTENHFHVLFGLIRSVCELYDKESKTYEANKAYFEDLGGQIISESNLSILLEEK